MPLPASFCFGSVVFFYPQKKTKIHCKMLWAKKRFYGFTNLDPVSKRQTTRQHHARLFVVNALQSLHILWNIIFIENIHKPTHTRTHLNPILTSTYPWEVIFLIWILIAVKCVVLEFKMQNSTICFYGGIHSIPTPRDLWLQTIDTLFHYSEADYNEKVSCVMLEFEKTNAWFDSNSPMSQLPMETVIV